MNVCKKIVFYSSSIVLGLLIGCNFPTGTPPETHPQSKYIIVWIYGVNHNDWPCQTRYYSDEIKTDGNWLVFVDKETNQKVKLAPTNVAVYGGE